MKPIINHPLLAPNNMLIPLLNTGIVLVMRVQCNKHSTGVLEDTVTVGSLYLLQQSAL